MRALLAVAVATTLASTVGAQTLPPYKITAEQKSDSQRVVDVRIERKLEETELATVAGAIADRETKAYPRTVVNFVLPSARAGDSPWASATIVREVRVKIPGLRLDEERQFTAEARTDQRNMVGTWLTTTPATPGRLTIYRSDGRLIAEWRMRSGVTTQDEVSETKAATGRRFDLKSGASEDHFVMLSGGDLEIRAKGTLIAVAERIKEAGSSPAPVASATTRDRNTEVERWPPAPAGREPPKAQPVISGAQAQTAAGAEGEPKHEAAPRRTAPRPVVAQARKAQPAATPKIDLSVYLFPRD